MSKACSLLFQNVSSWQEQIIGCPQSSSQKNCAAPDPDTMAREQLWSWKINATRNGALLIEQ